LAVIAGPGLASNGPPVVVKLLDASTGATLQVLKVNDAFQSAAWSSDGSRLYIAGGQDGVVHLFTAGTGGVFSAGADIALSNCRFVAGIALTHTDEALWVGCALDNVIHRVVLATGLDAAFRPAPGADQLSIAADDSQVSASDWRGNTVTQVAVATGAVSSVVVGDHPAGIAALPDGRVVVTNANDGTVATITTAPIPMVPEPAPLAAVGAAALVGLLAWRAPRGRRRLAARTGGFLLVALAVPMLAVAAPRVEVQVTDVGQVSRHGDSPNAVVAAPDGSRLYIALGADNAIAVLEPGSGGASPWRVAGLIPTGWYPDAVALSPDAKTLYAITARGLGQSAAATNPFVTPDPVNTGVNAAYATVGDLETIRVPDAATLAQQTAVARAGIAAAPTASNPVTGPGPSSIKHVIYVTRENKTYDADLGDLHPGPGTALVLFPRQNTPNLHALETGFVESQNFYYPGFRSTVGHMWEDAGGVADVYERGAGADTNALAGNWGNPANYPSSGLLVEQALSAGLTVRTYNEELAQQSTRVPNNVQAPETVFKNYDLAISDTSREMGWETEFKQFEDHQCTGVLVPTYGANCNLPALEYVYLGEDHTTVVDQPGYPTVEAQVADNDYATGRLIDAVSHSPDWATTLVIVVEDDPQGTGDDVSAYHGFIALASPWVKRGFISTVHYALPSVVGAVDRALGLPYLTDYAAESRPLDDLFTSTADMTPFTADASGVALFPFTPLPGTPPVADPAHGVFSFATPDQTDPALAWRSTWAQLKGTRPPSR
jgi:DNA-binding beta-propeller fold protein YncE